MIQQELDSVEKMLLTDIFGGYNSEQLCIGSGVFKHNIAPTVQSYIHKFENFIRKHMDNDGYLTLPSLGVHVKPTDLYYTLKGTQNVNRRTEEQLPAWFKDNNG